MAAYFYLNYDVTTGVCTGMQNTSVPLPTPLPPGVIVCTQAQAYQPSLWQVVNGQILDYLPGFKANQINVIKQSARQASVLNMAFTTASGTSSAFPMQQRFWVQYVGAYAKYVIYKQPLPAGFGFEDVNENVVPMAVADIENFYNVGEAQIISASGKKAGLIARINAVTGTSVNDSTACTNVQAIVW